MLTRACIDSSRETGRQRDGWKETEGRREMSRTQREFRRSAAVVGGGGALVRRPREVKVSGVASSHDEGNSLSYH